MKRGDFVDDEKIIELFFKRDDSAILETAKKYEKCLTRLSLNMLKSREDAQECINDTYFSAWNSIPPKKPNPLLSYLACICRNHALNRLRYSSSKKRSGITVLYDELEQCIENPDDVRRQDSREIAQAISSFLKSESETVQRLFVSRYFYSESIKAIAHEMGMSESNVKTQLFRIRSRLREFLIREEIYL